MSNTNQTKSSTRFNVGEVEYFINVDYKMNELRFGNMYIPWLDTLNGFHVLKLTCAEHHMVPWDQDPKEEKKYDGYVFKDDEGTSWHNQYPRASYGQITDAADWIVRRTVVSSDKLRFEKYTHFTNYIQDMIEGVSHLKKAGNILEAKKLQEWQDQLEQYMVKNHGLKFKIVPTMFGTAVELIPAPKRKTLEEARAETEALNKLARDMRGDLEVEKF